VENAGYRVATQTKYNYPDGAHKPIARQDYTPCFRLKKAYYEAHNRAGYKNHNLYFFMTLILL
jgi:hypothetical protein